MIQKYYGVQFEIAGSAAMFTNPSSGSVPITYPVPTRMALKAIFECVALSKHAYFVADKVEICKPIIYHRYTTNYGGMLKQKTNYQNISTILNDVCYKVYGHIEPYGNIIVDGINQQHCLQEFFNKKLKKGCFYRTPCMGLSDFPVSYMGELRTETKPCESVNLTINSLLDYTRFDCNKFYAPYNPTFIHNKEIQKGVLIYD